MEKISILYSDEKYNFPIIDNLITDGIYIKKRLFNTYYYFFSNKTNTKLLLNVEVAIFDNYLDAYLIYFNKNKWDTLKFKFLKSIRYDYEKEFFYLYFKDLNNDMDEAKIETNNMILLFEKREHES